jgi:hypothetical protein
MNMKKQKENGFGVIEVLIVIVVVSVIGFLGWNYISSSKEPTAQPVAQTEEVAMKSEDSTAQESSDDFFEIEEWGVGFTLVPDAYSVYYKLEPLYDDGDIFAKIYFSDFDKIKNADGESCEGSDLMRISRISVNDFREQSDNMEVWVRENAVQIGGYYYNGIPLSQAAPGCAYLESRDYKPDENVLDSFDKYRKAIIESFKTLESV